MNDITIRSGRFLLIAAITVLVAFVATAAAATAITGQEAETPTSGLHYVTYTMSAPEVSNATGVAHCPAGTKPIDGGVSSNSGVHTRRQLRRGLRWFRLAASRCGTSTPAGRSPPTGGPSAWPSADHLIHYSEREHS